MANKLAWHEIWEKFDSWYQKAEKDAKCSKCGHNHYSTPDWVDQQEKIAKLVESALRSQKYITY